MKISQKELQYIKNVISPEQLIDIISMKAKMNKKRALHKNKINESEEIQEASINENLSSAMNKFNEIFNTLDPKTQSKFTQAFTTLSDIHNDSITGDMYDLIVDFINRAYDLVLNRDEDFDE